MTADGPIATIGPPADTVQLWFACPDEITDGMLLSQYGQLLDAEEHAQWQRFHFARHRHQYLITRALIRSILSGYADVAPADWRFSRNQYGKPEIMPGLTDKPIRFNLSHTDGLVMCGVVLHHDLGVDVEYKQRQNVAVNIARRFFWQEINELFKLPPSEQKPRFFDYWTLKEAYIKARGLGLSLPLDQFTFHIDENKPVGIAFDGRLADDPQHWQFWRIKPTPDHIAAIAVKSASTITLSIKKVVPLNDGTDVEGVFL